MSNLQRYQQTERTIDGCIQMVKNETGDWVLYDEARAEIKRLQSLAVFSSGEGTCFYYKDLCESQRLEIERLRRAIVNATNA